MTIPINLFIHIAKIYLHQNIFDSCDANSSLAVYYGKLNGSGRSEAVTFDKFCGNDFPCFAIFVNCTK